MKLTLIPRATKGNQDEQVHHQGRNTDLYYNDWGSGQPVVFSHGWPLNADAFEDQMFYLASRGYRVIAHDRRGHGRSDQTWQGNDLDTYADDLAELTEKLDLKDAVHVGHSTGGGEVTRYLGRHGSKRVAKAVLIGAIPPLMLKTAANPAGLPIEVFDGLRASVAADRSAFWRDLKACPSTATTGPARRCRRGSGKPSGAPACRRAFLAPTSASRPSLRDRSHRKLPQEDRRPDADHSRRR